MSFKLFSCLFVLTLAVLACEGVFKSYFRNPMFRVLYYRNQGYSGSSDSNSVPTADVLVQNEEKVQNYEKDKNDDTVDRILEQEKGLSEDIHSFIPGSGKIKNDPNDLRPILYSMGRQLRQLVRAHNQSEVTNKNILSVLRDTLSWAKSMAASFYSLITTFQNR